MSAPLDAITIQILRNKIASLVEEMHYHFYRSGYSTIIRESRDFSCVVLDRNGRLIVAPPMFFHAPVYRYLVRRILDLYNSRDGEPGALLNRLFSARTLALFDRLTTGQVASYLSGLLIGAELRDASYQALAITLIGSDMLVSRYERAAAVLDIPYSRAPQDCIAIGQTAIALAGGLIGD